MRDQRVAIAVAAILGFLWIGQGAGHSQVALQHKSPGAVSLTNPWSQNGIAICAPASPLDFQALHYVPGVYQGNFRFSWDLDLNGQVVSHAEAPWDLTSSFAQNYTFQYTFYGVTPQPGTYTIHLVIQEFKGFWFFGSWQTVFDETSNAVVASDIVPTGSFKIRDVSGNFVPPSSSGSPIQVSLSGGIVIDASASSCDPAYLIIVEESDRWWNRTFANEWNRWFNGRAPSHLNLQQLTTTFSASNGTGYFSLLGGQFQSPPSFAGEDRFYRVGLQVGGAPWNPEFALIQVGW